MLRVIGNLPTNILPSFLTEHRFSYKQASKHLNFGTFAYDFCLAFMKKWWWFLVFINQVFIRYKCGRISMKTWIKNLYVISFPYQLSEVFWHDTVAQLAWVPWVPGNPSTFEQWVPEPISFGKKGLRFGVFSIQNQQHIGVWSLGPRISIWEPINLNL